MSKAVSPLLAGVLLIAVTVGIATLTTGFVSTTFRSTETAVSNKTTDSVSCTNAGIVIDDVYAKAGDNGTVAVPVRNSGFADLQLTSAQLYDKLGNNFSASGMPLSISRGHLINLNFQMPKFSNTTMDSSGLNNNGNCTNMGTGGKNDTCSFTLSGKSGSAMSFDGNDDYINAGNDSRFNITGEITVESFVKLNTVNRTEQAILGKYTSAGNDRSYLLEASFYNKSIFRVSHDGENWTDLNSSAAPVAGRWYHMAGVYNLTHLNLYVDGVLDNSTPYTSGIYGGRSPLYIGAFYYLTGPYGNLSGTLDEVAIWNRTLSGEEINSTMLSGVTSINTTGLVGYWKFDEGRGILSCPADFSQVVVTTNCGGISAAFDRTPKCS